jgi:hypothetical protein
MTGAITAEQSKAQRIIIYTTEDIIVPTEPPDVPLSSTPCLHVTCAVSATKYANSPLPAIAHPTVHFDSCMVVQLSR